MYNSLLGQTIKKGIATSAYCELFLIKLDFSKLCYLSKKLKLNYNFIENLQQKYILLAL